MFVEFYLVGLILISCMIYYIFYSYENDYLTEMHKIHYLEAKEKLKDNQLASLRSKTEPCPTELKTPRECYLKSDFQCSWNEGAERCDKKIKKIN